MICSCGINKLLEATDSYLMGCVNDDSEIKELFIENVSKDESKVNSFLSFLPTVKKQLKDDLSFFIESDPAADSEEEVILAYPGYKAIRYYRIAHILYVIDEPMVARIISEQAHQETGVDIHPGAKISSPFFIDHGTGTVIGETSIIGERVKIYQCVTIGALSLAEGHKMKGKKRHPTIGNDVTIYAGASVLGGEVIIGDNVVIGGNVFLTESVPSDTLVSIGKPKLLIRSRKQ